MEEHWTVGRVAELAGVSVRTLHRYDAIGLVRPSGRTAAGYRAYAAGDMERLREVLAYRRLGFGLREIAELVDDPSADAVRAPAPVRPLRLRPTAEAMQRQLRPDQVKDPALSPQRRLPGGQWVGRPGGPRSARRDVRRKVTVHGH
ncbi:MerR family transcriptional regulator [Streptomyces californicus]